MKKTIIITGTHHTPAHELINTLKKDKKINWDIHYIGRKHNSQDQKTLSVEYQNFPKLGVTFHPIKSGRFDRHSTLKTIAGLKKSLQGFTGSYRLVKKIKPNIVVSFGGYLSVPVIISSWMQKIPAITHEQTTTVSLSTKLNYPFVKKIALSFKNSSLASKKTIVTGNLLRSEIYDSNPGPFSKLKLKGKKLIYITGGNQGASFINQNLVKILPRLLKKGFIVIHQTGDRDYKKIKEETKNLSSSFYYPTPFVSAKHIGWILKNSDLIVSRSGANISQEIATLNKKAVLIPLPGTQNQEQEKNAYWTQKYAPTQILKQSSIEIPNDLLKNINSLLSQKSKTNYPKLDFKKSPQILLRLIHQLSL